MPPNKWILGLESLREGERQTSNELRGFDDANVTGSGLHDGHNLVAAKTHEPKALRAKLYGTYCDKNE